MKYLYLIVSCLLFVQCSHTKVRNQADPVSSDSLFASYNEKSYDYLYEYQNFDQDSALLDSALCVIDKGLLSFPRNPNLLLRKLIVLVEKQQYDAAIEFACDKPINFSGDSLYPYKEVLMERFEALKCMKEGNVERKNAHLQNALVLIEAYMKQHETKLAEYLERNKKEGTGGGPYMTAIMQYYICYAYLYGKEACLNKLNSDEALDEGLRVGIEACLTADVFADYMGV